MRKILKEFSRSFVSVFLLFVLVFSLFTISVSAEQVDYDIGLINLFDLQTNYPTVVRDGTLYKTRFDFPSGYKNYHYFEFYYYCSDANHTASIYRYDSFYANCTIVPCGNDYYKAYWSGGQGSSYINFVINTTGSISLSSAYYSDVPVNLTLIPFEVYSFNLGDTNFSDTGTVTFHGVYAAGDVANLIESETGVSEYCNFDNTVFISKSNWSKFDYISLHYDLRRYSLGSVNVKLGDVSVPYSLSYNDSIEYIPDEAIANRTSNSQLNIIIDLSDIPLTYNDALGINVTGTYFNSYGEDEVFAAIYGVSGFNKVNEVDTDVVWYRRIYLGLESWFSDLSNKLSSLISGNTQQNQNAEDFKDSVDQQASELESMTNVMNSVERPDINSINISSGSMVDSSSLVLATSGISSILGNSIILRVILMGLTFGLIGFVLYGKKG